MGCPLYHCAIPAPPTTSFNQITVVFEVTAGFTGEELDAFLKEPDVVEQVGDLLLQVLHALLLVGPGRRAAGGHEHRAQHLLVGLRQRPADTVTVRGEIMFSKCSQSKLTLDRKRCITSLNALPAR